MKDALKTGYKYLMIFCIVASIGCAVMLETGCKFLESAQESAVAVRTDLDGVNKRLAEVLEKLEVGKTKYDETMAKFAAARDAGDVGEQEALLKQAEIYMSTGKDLWKTLEDTKAEQEQLKTAYAGAVKRVEQAGTDEEKWGSIFGSILTGVTSLLGIGGIGGGVVAGVAARGSKKRADGYKEDSDDYRDGLKTTAAMLEKMKEFAPESWGKLDKAALLSKTSNAAIAKMDEARRR